MKKNVFGKKLKRDKNERKALFKSLMSALVLNERIKTTEAKAKAIRSEIERLVTKAKTKESGAKQVLEKSLSREAFEKIIKEIGPRFEKRQGGYTRIVKLGERLGDNSPIVLMEWVEIPEVVIPDAKKEDKSRTEKKMSKIKVSKKQEKPTKKTSKVKSASGGSK